MSKSLKKPWRKHRGRQVIEICHFEIQNIKTVPSENVLKCHWWMIAKMMGIEKLNLMNFTFPAVFAVRSSNFYPFAFPFYPCLIFTLWAAPCFLVNPSRVKNAHERFIEFDICRLKIGVINQSTIKHTNAYFLKKLKLNMTKIVFKSTSQLLHWTWNLS